MIISQSRKVSLFERGNLRNNQSDFRCFVFDRAIVEEDLRLFKIDSVTARR